ncbi:MAG TPA: GntR family transcriptional regulator [Trinickia sp.]|jgi:GntR family transcriptional regulator|uniref:GntR family transcriptional regulator n=1 Tax=Trinickia sp. TaxID=2571163 RepID=UPI002CADABB0|nr:GntR family transcriptional regulator [Trinickia sp.]HTI16482.1 GntR family transcriptional regulator [Trinickia sp.]
MTTAKLIPLSPQPLYVQIKEWLRASILDGTLAPHEQLPSESDLTAQFGVSRITVRQAIGDLQKEGLVFRIHGKGTYVSKPKAFQQLVGLQGFDEAMRALGYETYSKFLGVADVPATQEIARALQLKPGARVGEIRRIRYLNRAPISLDVSYFPCDLAPRLAREDLASRDIFAILENDLGLALGHADVCVEASLADDVTAPRLDLEEGAPLMRITRLTWTADGRPIDFEHLHYRGDAFQYRLRVERSHAASAPQRSSSPASRNDKE